MLQFSSMLERSVRDVPRDMHEQNHYQNPRQPHLHIGSAVAYSPVEYYQRVAQSPPSPPAEEVVQHKPSLPSISSLLGIADGDRVNKEAGKANHLD